MPRHTCSYPWVVSTFDHVTSCKRPCEIHEFWRDFDNGCHEKCPQNWISSIDKLVSVCQAPCKPRHFLYSDGECYKKCNRPLISSIIDGIRYCGYVYHSADKADSSSSDSERNHNVDSPSWNPDGTGVLIRAGMNHLLIRKEESMITEEAAIKAMMTHLVIPIG